MLITHHWISNSRILILQTFSLGNQLVGVSTLKIPLGSDSLTFLYSTAKNSRFDFENSQIFCKPRGWLMSDLTPKLYAAIPTYD